RPDNLGPVSRPVHRAKTHGRWKVAQVASGFFLWTSPLDYHYLVTPSRTYPLDEPASPPVDRDVERALGKTLAQHTIRRPLPTVTIDL
ncbi:MAG TPA: hypothetical protein VLR88_11040, partial [Propionibacteriaceae bacterium]|nr:hypothetical protein [Propionibacteriaceae bacterium]